MKKLVPRHACYLDSLLLVRIQNSVVIRNLPEYFISDALALVEESINFLDTSANGETIMEISTSSGVERDDVDAVMQSVASLIWEFVRAGSAIVSVSDILQKVGLSSESATVISQVCCECCL